MEARLGQDRREKETQETQNPDQNSCTRKNRREMKFCLGMQGVLAGGSGLQKFPLISFFQIIDNITNNYTQKYNIFFDFTESD